MAEEMEAQFTNLPKCPSEDSVSGSPPPTLPPGVILEPTLLTEETCGQLRGLRATSVAQAVCELAPKEEGAEERLPKGKGEVQGTGWGARTSEV